MLRVLEQSERVVPAGTPILEVGDASRLEIVIEVLSTDAVRVRPGMPVNLAGWGGEGTLPATVRTVEPAAFTKVSALGVEEQRVRVIADLAGPPGPLGDGYRVEARIVTWSADSVLKVPASALFRRAPAGHRGSGRGGRSSRSTEGRARLRPVEPGHRTAAEVEIAEGNRGGRPRRAAPAERAARRHARLDTMKRAIVIRFSSLGDVVLTLPVTRSLKEAFPGRRDRLPDESRLPAAARGPARDRSRRHAGGGRARDSRRCAASAAGSVTSTSRWICTARCAAARAWARCDADRRLSYRKDALLRRLWAAGWMRGRMEGVQPHVIDRYLEPLRRFGVAPAHTVPQLVVPPERLSAVRDLLVAAGVRDPDRVAVVVPGARWPNKRWSPASFAAVAAGLRDAEGLEPVIAGDASDREAAEAVRALIPGGAPLLAGRTDLHGTGGAPEDRPRGDRERLRPRPPRGRGRLAAWSRSSARPTRRSASRRAVSGCG